MINFNNYSFIINIIKDVVIKKFYSVPSKGRKITIPIENIIKATIYVLRTGCQWYSLPKDFGNFSTIFKHFHKWSQNNVFEDSWKIILDHYQKLYHYSSNLKHQLTDCSFIKSMRGIDCIGRNPTDRGRMGNKLSILTDIFGIPIGFLLSTANVSDQKLLSNTLKRRILFRKRRSYLHADKGYSNQSCKNISSSYNYELIAPNKKNFIKPLFNISPKNYRYRVESCFSWIKSFRRIILRYESYIYSYQSFLTLSFCLLTNNKLQ